MKAKLGDTIAFDYSASGVHDKHPQIFFLAKVGTLIHGMNQHYQSPQEKTYFFLTLKNILYTQIKNRQLTANDFYIQYVRSRLRSNSYRTYDSTKISNARVIPIGLFTFTRGVDKKTPDRGRYTVFYKGDRVQYVSMVQKKLSMKTGTVIGRYVPGMYYNIQADSGEVIQRHPADLKKI